MKERWFKFVFEINIEFGAFVSNMRMVLESMIVFFLGWWEAYIEVNGSQ